MERIVTKLIVLFSLFLLSTLYSLLSTSIIEAAPTVSCEELLKDAEKYNGKIVVYKGEVIGDIMVRGESAWVNVRDATGVLGIFCPQELVGAIERAGSYKFTGDIISVRGTFHHSCPEHGGDTDIHAEKITIMQKGERITHPLEPGKIKLSIGLVVAAFLLSLIHLILRRLR